MSHLDEIGGVEPRVLNAYNLPGTSSYTIPLAVLGPLTTQMHYLILDIHYNYPLKFPSRIHYILCCI